ncbi:MAG: hypothetical protein IKW28_02575 [Lachnospiraceae bacterium]|nr:hypothetical protein [Lachnospiraceae bacterium]
MNNNNWMNDEDLKNIAEEKLLFLQNMLFESKKYQGKELFPFFMSLAVKAKQKNISYNQEELDLIIPVLKKYASEEEIEKMNKVITMFRKNK